MADRSDPQVIGQIEPDQPALAFLDLCRDWFGEAPPNESARVIASITAENVTTSAASHRASDAPASCNCEHAAPGRLAKDCAECSAPVATVAPWCPRCGGIGNSPEADPLALVCRRCHYIWER